MATTTVPNSAARRTTIASTTTASTQRQYVNHEHVEHHDHKYAPHHAQPQRCRLCGGRRVATVQESGSASTSLFTITKAPYEVGYAYDCQTVPTADRSFEIGLMTKRGAAAAPVFYSKKVNGTGARGRRHHGAQRLVVETATACQWVLRVVAP